MVVVGVSVVCEGQYVDELGAWLKTPTAAPPSCW